MNPGQPRDNSTPIDISPERRKRGVRYYNASQLRMDTWNEFQVNCNWLHEYASASKPIDGPVRLVAECLQTLDQIEYYWAYPGRDFMDDLHRLLENREYTLLARAASEVVRLVVGDAYREHYEPISRLTSEAIEESNHDSKNANGRRLYFEVLVVDGSNEHDQREMRQSLTDVVRPQDEFAYGIVTVSSFEDAVIAILFNRTIQSCVLRYNFKFNSQHKHEAFTRYRDLLADENVPECYGHERSLALAALIKKWRPEVDIFLITDAPLEDLAGYLGRDIKRTFYRLEQYLELHLSILKGIRARYETPFFDALRRYSQKPTGVFHALPIARGKSIASSHWARDLIEFYGSNLFLAETSATSGGLDSLLQPRGPIKRAQELAARAFGAHETFFVTNGTSTANKIVVQALVRPGDIVLIDRDCHKSHHYALMLAGALPVYLDSYPLEQYSMYGAVPLSEIKHQLLALKEAGKLDKVRMLLLTNCTFDGLTYHPQRIMEEILAIKPDMIFLWDEAWFAYASFSPTLRPRTAMNAAAKLRAMYHSDAYREAYKQHMSGENGEDDINPMASPDEVRVRVYSTHSTHKTLTALRQASMIHVFDEDFEQRVSDAFHEAYMTHTSTSPNYQIIASLDVARRQVQLEGYELVHRSIGLAMTLRRRIYEHPVIRKYFSVLRPADMIPQEYRPSGLEFYYDPEQGWSRMEDCWRTDEFALDPTRVTIEISRTGMNGDEFRHLLMDEYDIQINKTSRNSALFMTNIGTTRGDIAYLVEVLARIAQDIDDRIDRDSAVARRKHEQRVEALEHGPSLPDFSRFHPAFKPGHDEKTPEGDLRRAFFLAYDQAACEYLDLDGSVRQAIEHGREVVSADFVIPYPPGFPILVPGQVISRAILDYLHAVDVKEIHGYKPEYGLRVFKPDVLDALLKDVAPPRLSHERMTQ